MTDWRKLSFRKKIIHYLNLAKKYGWSEEWTAGKIIECIYNAGYTKKHFPVEKLEEQILKVQQKLADSIDGESPATVESISAMGASANCGEILKFIKELKEERWIRL
jgi:hypothetical protein